MTLCETIPVRIDTTGQIGEIDHPPGAGVSQALLGKRQQAAADALAGGALVSEDLPNQDQREGGSRLILVPTANALEFVGAATWEADGGGTR